MSRFSPFVAVLLAGILAGCTTRAPESLAQNDPLEPMNRASFNVNLKLDKYIAKPIAKGYVAVVPEPARDGIHNFLTNLDEPVTFANNVLQGDAKGAAHTFMRFSINSTVGIGGILDLATKWGYPDDPQDFGLTLGKGGLPEGDYLFLPFIGPSSPRDVLGTGVDIAFDPLTYISFNNSTTWYMARQAAVVLDTRAQTLDQLEGIERTSVDFYATTRSLYRQHRAAQIRGGAADLQNLPSY
jgi:phospholipid-binding lipoprotein MlaA